jgi:hypothetical protein
MKFEQDTVHFKKQKKQWVMYEMMIEKKGKIKKVSA